MAYTLVSAEYVPPDSGIKFIRGIKGGRIPRGAIRSGNSFYLRGEAIPAEFKFYFEDEKNIKYFFDAHSIIKETMVNQNLTENRRNRIIDEVKNIAAVSEKYEPEKWFVKAVKTLKI